MEFRTIVDIAKPEFRIEPCEELLFVGSCFADSIGQRFREEGFPVTVNPYGTMYNPASVLHTIEKYEGKPRTAFITLGTNHVYRLKETGEIVDNCEKRPQALFQEEELSVDACADYLRQAIAVLRKRRPDVRVVMTVSPIRYRKYGYHESQVSKATLLLAIEKVLACDRIAGHTAYFPAYEIVMDELRDYRFYAADMLHPSAQAVEYIWERLVESYFSPEAKAFLDEWRPLKQALGHKPFNPDSEEYRALMDKTMLKVAELRKKYSTFAL
jgi:lysophospholipase L1-like esterase